MFVVLFRDVSIMFLAKTSIS